MIYELTYILSSENTSEKAQEKASSIASAVQTHTGVVLQQSAPGAKTLAYPIKKNSSGFVGVIEFELEEGKIKEIEDAIQKDKDILRHLVLAKKPFKVKKEKRTRKPPVSAGEAPAPKAVLKSAEEAKPVEIADIEKELDKILGE